jgi:uncharacterized protein involved in outer membrane biogenesis
LLGAVLALAVAIAVPFLVPVERFIPDLERLASQKLGQPVSVEDLRLYLLPFPRVVASRISIGKRDQVMIGELELQPDLLSLLSGPRTVRLIRADRVAVDVSAFALLSAMPKSKSTGEPILVHRILLTTVKFNHASVDLPLFDVDVHLREGLRLREARFETRDGSVTLVVQPNGAEGSTVALAAANWTLPVGAPLMFEELAARGTLKGGELELSQIEGLLYGGKLAGSARADWTKQWQLSGKATLAGVDLVPVQKALGKPAKLSGRLKADAAFSSSAKEARQLREALFVDGPFEVVGGAYQGVDLAKAGNLTGERAVDDATVFQELKGNLELRGENVKLNQLCVRSPKVVAGGNVEIAADRALSGKLDVSVAQTGGFLGVPVSLGGTTDEPSVRPSKGYLIGAAIGTMLLPGIGTSIGSSLGGRIEGTSDCK